MKKLFPLLLLVITMTACQKEPDWGKLSNDLLVYTHYDEEFDFSKYNTFYIPDSVLLLDNTKEEPVYISSDDVRARTILEVLSDEMHQRGYTQVYDRADADLGMITSYIKHTNTYVGYEYPYWWYDFYYYWPFDYWDPFYFDWYPYYPYPVAYSYTTSTIAVEIIALNDADANTKVLPFVWTACLAGIESSNQLNISNAVAGIYQAFEQSPYIAAQ
ncbi:MAG: DUF4136 domain-containing protein [Bacteroidaceae bacterium]|nr:DUF4136 domain-containing protein [Bacteroidaceae bacterium]